jgi:hypothetical protein
MTLGLVAGSRGRGLLKRHPEAGQHSRNRLGLHASVVTGSLVKSCSASRDEFVTEQLVSASGGDHEVSIAEPHNIAGGVEVGHLVWGVVPWPSVP